MVKNGDHVTAESHHGAKRDDTSGRYSIRQGNYLVLVGTAFLCTYFLSWYTQLSTQPVPPARPPDVAASRPNDGSSRIQATAIKTSPPDKAMQLKKSSSDSASSRLGYEEQGAKDHVSAAQKITTVAFVVTITGCGDEDPDHAFPIADGAAVLKHSIHRNFIHSPVGHQEDTRAATDAILPSTVVASRYDYRMFAMYHPVAERCVAPLKELNYTLLERDVPVPVNEIQGQLLRKRIVNDGCCGEKELIKFEAFTMVEFPVVVLLDLDVLILKPLNNLFDLILHRKLPPAGELLRPKLGLPATIDVLHTIDYEMAEPDKKIKPFQGGFAILRPNMTIYDEIVAIVRKGDFRVQGGWSGETGHFWGGMTFQGIMAYYFHVLYPGRSVELNSCIYNNMCSPARTPEGECYNQIANCTDCREQPIDEVAVFHFTICEKPWLCQRHSSDEIAHRRCLQLHHEWFVARSEMEQSWGRPSYGTGTWNKDHFMGFCTSFGKDGYVAIQAPYGQRSR